MLTAKYSITPILPERDLPRLHDLLSQLPPWRRQLALSYRNPLDRLQSAFAYLTLAALLRNDFGIDDFKLNYDHNGRPTLSDYTYSGSYRHRLHISLSHCRCAVMAAADVNPVGCDVEEIVRPYDPTVADYCFTADERREITESDDSATAFARLWTIKESIYKLDNSIATDISCVSTAVLRSKFNVISQTASNYVATLVTI